MVITDDGTPLLKVPVRKQGELTYYADGSVVFYEPFVNPVTNELILDSATGEPLFPSEYWFVPHNTFPLPAGSITSEPEEEGSALEDSFSTEEFDELSER